MSNKRSPNDRIRTMRQAQKLTSETFASKAKRNMPGGKTKPKRGGL